MQGDENIPSHDSKTGGYVTKYICQNSVSFIKLVLQENYISIKLIKNKANVGAPG